MSRFSKYATAVDNAAKQAFKKYHDAATALSWAERTKNATPRKSGAGVITSAEYDAKAAKAEAVYLEAVQDVKKAQSAILSDAERLSQLRKQLASDIEESYCVDPAQIDANTVELLKSGIMRPSEYERLMSSAINGGNLTMARLIGRYADDAATAATSKGELGKPEAVQLRTIAEQARNLNGNKYLEAFDFLVDTMQRCGNTPGMIDHWEELTENTINAF